MIQKRSGSKGKGQSIFINKRLFCLLYSSFSNKSMLYSPNFLSKESNVTVSQNQVSMLEKDPQVKQRLAGFHL